MSRTYELLKAALLKIRPAPTELSVGQLREEVLTRFRIATADFEEFAGQAGQVLKKIAGELDAFYLTKLEVTRVDCKKTALGDPCNRWAGFTLSQLDANQSETAVCSIFLLARYTGLSAAIEVGFYRDTDVPHQDGEIEADLFHKLEFEVPKRHAVAELYREIKRGLVEAEVDGRLILPRLRPAAGLKLIS